jgi:MFS family permease
MSGLALAFRSFRTRNYRLFWFGQLVSLAGTWMQDLAISWLVYSLSGSGLALGLTMTIRFGPALLFSLYGGVLADRLRKRRTMIYCEVLQLVIALTLAILMSADLLTVGIIWVLAGVRGVGEAVQGPIRQSFVPEMVGTEDLTNAIALNSTQFNAARIIGPAVGAIIVKAIGYAACFYINAASFIAVIGALLAMRVSELHLAPRLPREPVLEQVREGLRYARSQPDVVAILIVVGFIGAFGYNFMTLTPLITKEVLHRDVGTLGWLITTMAVGSVLAALFMAYRGRPTRRLLLVPAGLFSIMLAALAVSRWVPLTTVLMFGVGLTGILFMTTANTRLQLAVPGHMRGRVMGIYAVLFVGTTPIGATVMGALAEGINVPVMVLIMAGLCAAGVLWAGLYLRGAGTADSIVSGAVIEKGSSGDAA